MERFSRTSSPPAGATQRDKRLLAVFLLLLSAAFLFLGGRLFQIQVLEHEERLAAATRVRSRSDRIPAYRGDLRSRDGVVLARDQVSYEVGLDPSRLAEAELPLVLRIICDTLGQAPERRREAIERALQRKRSGSSGVRLAVRVGEAEVEAVREALRRELPEGALRREGLKALAVTASTHRTYPRRGFLAAVLGATGVDGRGLEGLELQLDAYLVPRPGRREVVVDARQRSRIYAPEKTEVAPVNGYDAYLTIDMRTQRIVEEELERGIEAERAEAGLAVVMDCRSGDIRAMASWPGFDPNHYSDYPAEERSRRRKNRVIENVYEPGSVIKPFIVAGVLEKGLAHRDQLIWEGGRSTRIGRRRINDVSDHGPLTVDGVVVHSSNIGMSMLGLKLGADGIIDVLERFGFCRESGIALPGEGAGRHTPRKKWKELYSTLSVSFGYEVLVTPIQLCAAFAALINGGYLLKPRIVERLAGEREERLFPPQVVGRPLGEETSRELREILLKVVKEGTGRSLKIDGLEFGGKTGTADMDPRYTKKDYLSSFEAFAPYEEPEVVVLVMIEKPRSGRYYGGTVAGPVVSRILRRMFRIEAPEKPGRERLVIAARQ
jgi:cell division protein FtsI/penicillin-binding protein 2